MAEDHKVEEKGRHRIWCTRCGSPYIRGSHRSSPLDWLMRPFGIQAFRCHTCYARFRRFIPWGRLVKTYAKAPADEPSSHAKRKSPDLDS